jgi:hypothetical protein
MSIPIARRLLMMAITQAAAHQKTDQNLHTRTFPK